MADAEKVVHDGKVYAIIVRSGLSVDGVEFFTPKEYPFQLGVHDRGPNLQLKPHIHSPKPKAVDITQEMLHVCKGRIEVKLYDDNKIYFCTTVLNSGDTILFAAGGHGIKFIEKTRIIEIKQGPYDGTQSDKEMIE